MLTCRTVNLDISALPAEREPIYNKLLTIGSTRIEERSGAKVTAVGAAFTLRFALDDTLPAEGYTISDIADGLLIQGNGFRGLMYGLGRFLHTSRYDDGAMYISEWRGTSSPECSLRTMYYALHFYNGYHTMPSEELVRHLEDLMLWGFNCVCATFARVSVRSLDDSGSEQNFRLLETLFSTAKSLDMYTAIFNGPTDLMNPDPELVADKTGIYGKGGNALCTSNPRGFARISYINTTIVRRLAPIGLDYVVFFPYDEGGCSCSLCAPWGGNGYYRWAKRQYFEICKAVPNPPKAILSTWHFGYGINDPRDFAWLDRAIREDKAMDNDWVTYMMLETRRGIPEYIQEHGVPGGVPAIDFPEITMRYLEPWGGWGATPLPTEVERMWRGLPDGINGGVCYTEGFYDDVNKAVIGRLMWDKSSTSRAVFDDYCGYELRQELSEDFWELSCLLEHNQYLTHYTVKQPPNMDEVARIRELGEQMNAALPEFIRTGWRWRLMYLRCVLDYERYTAGEPCGWNLDQLDIRSRFAHWGYFLVGNKRAQDALWELIEMYRMPHVYDPNFHVLHHYIRPCHESNPAYQTK